MNKVSWHRFGVLGAPETVKRNRSNGRFKNSRRLLFAVGNDAQDRSGSLRGPQMRPRGNHRANTPDWFSRLHTVAPRKHDVSSYDLVVIGTPVWGWSLSSPVRAYLMATASQLPEVAFFCTLGGAGSDSAFAQMTAIVGKKPRAVCAITEREALSGSHVERLTAFEKAIAENH
jgi:hypothetical protein